MGTGFLLVALYRNFRYIIYVSIQSYKYYKRAALYIGFAESEFCP